MKTANADAGTNTWTLRLFTFLVWSAVGLCATYWVFKFVTTKPVEATAGIVTPAVAVDTKAVAKLLGATDSIAVKPLITTASVKLTLFGLAASRNGQGFALIATEDKPAKPYRVGAQVTDDLVLKSISKADAVLAASISALDGQKLELPSRKLATFVSVAAGDATSLFYQLPSPSIIPPDAIPEQPPVSISRDIAESGRRTNRIATRP